VIKTNTLVILEPEIFVTTDPTAILTVYTDTVLFEVNETTTNYAQTKVDTVVVNDVVYQFGTFPTTTVTLRPTTGFTDTIFSVKSIGVWSTVTTISPQFNTKYAFTLETTLIR
jgi:hypothetical protein